MAQVLSGENVYRYIFDNKVIPFWSFVPYNIKNDLRVNKIKELVFQEYSKNYDIHGKNVNDVYEIIVNGLKNSITSNACDIDYFKIARDVNLLIKNNEKNYLRKKRQKNATLLREKSGNDAG